MSLKNRDEHNRWRNKTVAFRVSPEEDAQIERYVQLSGLTKQDYITRRLTHKDVVVQGNPRVFQGAAESACRSAFRNCSALRLAAQSMMSCWT